MLTMPAFALRRNETNDDLAAEVDELKARLVAQVGDRSAAREATKQAQQQEKDDLLAEEADLMAKLDEEMMKLMLKDRPKEEKKEKKEE
eukprot:COSAG04_NODE_6891_length_1233_cov_3.492945_2_plen_89_part_00